MLSVGIAAVAVAGCSKPSATVSTDGAKMTFEDKDGQKATIESDEQGATVKVQSRDGDSTYESGATITEAELGLPFYPGSTEKPNGTIRTDTPDGKSLTMIRSTPDDPSKVVDFYKPKLKEAQTQTTSAEGTNHSMLFGKTESGSEVVITAVQQKDAKATDVSVSVMVRKAK